MELMQFNAGEFSMNEPYGLNSLYFQILEEYFKACACIPQHLPNRSSKIMAIKYYRTLTGASLKDAKDHVESVIDSYRKDYEEDNQQNLSLGSILEKAMRPSIKNDLTDLENRVKALENFVDNVRRS